MSICHYILSLKFLSGCKRKASDQYGLFDTSMTIKKNEIWDAEC